MRRGDEQGVEIKVSDTGNGIAKDDLAKVFDSFWQGGAEKRGGYPGIGLGLVIAKQVVERHGGRITVAAGEPDGTRVSMVLPQPAEP
mgnify:FL=1